MLIQSKKFVESAPFDQVICSLHLLDGKDLFYESCYTEDKHTVYLNYLNTMIKLIKQHEFANILGHVDYICRYAPYAKKDICYEEFHDTIDTLWQTIIDKDIVPELNTRRFDNSNNISILLKLYERYAMLGGKYVSIGSDAHKPENIGFAFKEAYALLDKLNLQPVYFVNRQCSSVKFKINIRKKGLSLKKAISTGLCILLLFTSGTPALAGSLNSTIQLSLHLIIMAF